MPEADAVRRTARRLDEALAGRLLTGCDIRVPRYATVDLTGFEVLGTAVAGKHLLTRTLRDGRAVTLHSHLRMDGRWRTGPPAPAPSPGSTDAVRVWLLTEGSRAVGERLGMVTVLPTEQEERITGRLGPDILDPSADPAAIAARVRQQGTRPLAEALLDQAVVSGLGTIWTAEAAFAAGAAPWSPAAGCADLAGALAAVRDAMLRSAAARSRSEIPRYRVYGRRGQPCPRCATPVRSGRVGTAPTDRITYWCPACQTGPAGRGADRGR